jgi:dUTP pyrophosphatase
MIEVRIHAAAGARLPEYQSAGASGADIFALLDEDVTIRPGGTVLIPTGVSIEIPDGYEAQIRPRSGLAAHHGITLLNTPGTIDSDYRGEIKVIVTNLGKQDFTVRSGMRIAQIVFCRVYRGAFTTVDELAGTDRDDGGFGHTGV